MVKAYIQKLLAKAVRELNKEGFIKSEIKEEEIGYPPDSSFGDYSSNVALGLAQSTGRDASDLAEKIALKLSDLDYEDERVFKKIGFAAGFINFWLSEEYLVEVLKQTLKEKDKYGSSSLGKKQKILVEYFQPNIAKPLHLGHLRTAIIGDALFRILQSQGFACESETHLGDWGTQFGLLLAAYKMWGDDKIIQKSPVEELNKLYVRINSEAESNPALRVQGKAEFVKLEKGDKENRKLWKKFVDWSWREFEQIYDLLKIRRADHNWAESFYEDKMDAVVEKLKAKKLLKESEGAQIVDLSEYNLGTGLVIKSDGATTYLLRDLATFIFRKSKGFKKQLYVVDVRQKHTLAQTFKILELMGEIKEPGEAVHVDFGFLSLPTACLPARQGQAGLPEGAMSTRKGNVIGPAELLQKAHEKVLEIIDEKNPGLKEKDEVAWQVARGAIKYFDLSHNRKSDIVFRWDEVLDFEGNSGPYLQYTYARIKSILRKAGRTALSKKMSFQHAEEWRLLRQLVRFSEVLELVGRSFCPNILAEYLYRLAGDFNNFYQKIRVLNESDKEARTSRLRLVGAMAQVLKNGLDLLGIETPEEM